VKAVGSGNGTLRAHCPRWRRIGTLRFGTSCRVGASAQPVLSEVEHRVFGLLLRRGLGKGVVMGYYDGNTVTAFWNYAQHFAMSDNSYSTTLGLPLPAPSTLFPEITPISPRMR